MQPPGDPRSAHADETGTNDDVVEVALAAKVGISLQVTEIRLSNAIFAKIKLLLCDLVPTTQAVRGGHDLGRGSSELINREKGTT